MLGLGEYASLDELGSSSFVDNDMIVDGDSCDNSSTFPEYGSFSDDFSRDLKVHKVCQKFPTREKEIKMLFSFLEQSPIPIALPSCVYVWGPTATGKTCVTTEVIRRAGLSNAYCDCSIYSTPSAFYRSILRQFDESLQLNFVSANQFVYNLKKIFKSRSDEAGVILLDKPERLRNKKMNSVLGVLLRLQELADCNIGLVMISILPWESLLNNTYCSDVLKIYFTPYSEESMKSIILANCTSEPELRSLSVFFDLIWGMFFQITRDLNEFRHLITLLYPVYRLPVDQGEVTLGDYSKLWGKIQPYFKSTLLSQIYLRDISSTEWINIINDMKNSYLDDEEQSALTTTGYATKNEIEKITSQFDLQYQLELPYYCKALLCASFIASHNPASSDRSFFSSYTSSRRKTRKRPAQLAKHHLSGPKSFPLERMLAIFYKLIDVKTSDTALINLQIESLVRVGLLTRISHPEVLDALKYRCNIHQDDVRKLGASIRIEINNFLYKYS